MDGTDADLERRARTLSRRYLGGHAQPTSVRWVPPMTSRWASCTPSSGTIRLSQDVRAMPSFVRDYLLLHELAHLLVDRHGPDFWRLLSSYPHLERAREHLRAHGGAPIAGDCDRGD